MNDAHDLIVIGAGVAGHGHRRDRMRLNWADLMAYKRGFTEPVSQSLQARLTRHGVATLHGTARFQSEHRLVVDDRSDGSTRFLIATGVRP